MLLSAVGIAPAGKSNERSPLCTGVDHLCNEVQLHLLLCSCASLYLSERADRCAIITFAACPHLCSCSCGWRGDGEDQDLQLRDVPALVLAALQSQAGSFLSAEAALCRQGGPAPRMPGSWVDAWMHTAYGCS